MRVVSWRGREGGDDETGRTGFIAQAWLRMTILRPVGSGMGALSTLNGCSCLDMSHAAWLVSVDDIVRVAIWTRVNDFETTFSIP